MTQFTTAMTTARTDGKAAGSFGRLLWRLLFVSFLVLAGNIVYLAQRHDLWAIVRELAGQGDEIFLSALLAWSACRRG